MTDRHLGSWRATYTPGRWVVLAGPTAMVVMPPAPAGASTLLNDLWDDLLGAATMPDLVARLAAFRVDRMPSFAAFFWHDGQLRSLMRGQVSAIDVTTGERVAVGGDVVSWVEAGLGDVRQVRIDLEPVDQEQVLQLPLVTGVVTASAVVLDATDIATSIQLVDPTVAAMGPAAGAPGSVDSEAPTDPAAPAGGEQTATAEVTGDAAAADTAAGVDDAQTADTAVDVDDTEPIESETSGLPPVALVAGGVVAGGAAVAAPAAPFPGSTGFGAADDSGTAPQAGDTRADGNSDEDARADEEAQVASDSDDDVENAETKAAGDEKQSRLIVGDVDPTAGLWGSAAATGDDAATTAEPAEDDDGPGGESADSHEPAERAASDESAGSDESATSAPSTVSAEHTDEPPAWAQESPSGDQPQWASEEASAVPAWAQEEAPATPEPTPQPAWAQDAAPATPQSTEQPAWAQDDVPAAPADRPTWAQEETRETPQPHGQPAWAQDDASATPSGDSTEPMPAVTADTSVPDDDTELMPRLSQTGPVPEHPWGAATAAAAMDAGLPPLPNFGSPQPPASSQNAPSGANPFQSPPPAESGGAESSFQPQPFPSQPPSQVPPQPPAPGPEQPAAAQEPAPWQPGSYRQQLPFTPGGQQPNQPAYNRAGFLQPPIGQQPPPPQAAQQPPRPPASQQSPTMTGVPASPPSPQWQQAPTTVPQPDPMNAPFAQPPVAVQPPGPISQGPGGLPPTPGAGVISSVPQFGGSGQPTPTPTPTPVSDDEADHDGATVFQTGLARALKSGPTSNAAGGESFVLAALCVQQHPNPPGSTRCRVCGAPVPQQNPRLVARPILAVLRPSSGHAVEVDRNVLVGRAPSASRVSRDQLPRLLTVPSPSHDISRTHVQVHPSEWDIVVTDLHSTNGTTLVHPDGQSRERLVPGEPVSVPVGSVLDLGDGQTILIDAP